MGGELNPLNHTPAPTRPEATPPVYKCASLGTSSLCSALKNSIHPPVGTSLPSTVKALRVVYCHFILKGCTSPWCLSTAMQVIVRISVTMAVDWTNGTILQMKGPAVRKQDNLSIQKNKNFFLSLCNYCS